MGYTRHHTLVVHHTTPHHTPATSHHATKQDATTSQKIIILPTPPSTVAAAVKGRKLRSTTTTDMVKKRVDDRVRALIESGVRNGHRSMFVLVGDHGKDQVENLHKILAKTRVKANPSVLWCYKKELGFSTHRKKRMNEIKRNKARGLHDPDRDDPFDLFISTTDIRWAYYKETDKIIGQTFGMVVLQDFEALTPNLLARTIETVEGGGLVILLLKTVKSLKQLYTISMDVHSRFRTEAHHEIIPRFNERFILSLGECVGCLVLDDELNILPISGGAKHLLPDGGGGSGSGGGGAGDGDRLPGYSERENGALRELKASLENTPHVGRLVAQARTEDQAKAVLSFLDAISERTLRSTVALTAARGRGKSAAIGLCLAGAVSFGYSNIFVTAPSPENLKTVFQFIISGLKALKYTEHLDFEVSLCVLCGVRVVVEVVVPGE
jgi:N-acetyltransferase 10